MLTQNQGFHIKRTNLKVIGKQRSESSRIQNGAQTHDLVRGKNARHDREVGQDIDRVADNQNRRMIGQLDVFETFKNAVKQANDAVD
jgi:hypothetical protein